jgi:hypothetical protein
MIDFDFFLYFLYLFKFQIKSYLALKSFKLLKEATYSVKDFEGFSDFVFCILVVDLHGHHGQELGEVDRAGSVFVDLVHHILKKL